MGDGAGVRVEEPSPMSKNVYLEAMVVVKMLRSIDALCYLLAWVCGVLYVFKITPYRSLRCF